MCVDIVAPGQSITIELLHERIYFTTGFDFLTVGEWFDAFIRNDTPDTEIRQLRIQFPHYVDWSPGDCANLWHVTPPTTDHEERWFGSYRHVEGNVYVHVLKDGKEYKGAALAGQFAQPGETGELEAYRNGMREIPGMVLDLNLETPIRFGHPGWLRLNVTPNDWPGKQKFAVGNPSPLDGWREFKAHLTISSPSLLRDELLDGIRRKQPQWFMPLVIEGWHKAGTLSRMLDHRISLVFPRDLELTHLVTSTHSSPLVTVEPFMIDSVEPPGADDVPRFAQSFLSGSNMNQETDIVTMADRIRHYVQTQLDPPQDSPPVSKPDLVTRFAGANQEAVGTFIREMIENGLLYKAREDDKGEAFYFPQNRDTWRLALNHLREKYVSLRGVKAELSPYYQLFRDLHLFNVSFMIQWGSQPEDAQPAIQSVPVFDLSRPTLLPAPRRALLVVGSEYEHHDSIPILDKTATELAALLEWVCQFDVRLIMNPQSDDEVRRPLQEELDRFEGAGKFLFWFIGHARTRNADSGMELELYHCKSANAGLRWSSALQVLDGFPIVSKALILECCHAGQAARGAALPENSFLWCVAGPNSETVVTDGSSKSAGFSNAMRNTLLEGVVSPNDRLPIQLLPLLQRAQKSSGLGDAFPSQLGISQGIDANDLDAALNLARYDVLPDALLDQLRAQVLRRRNGAGESTTGS